MKIHNRDIQVSNLEKVLFPDDQITKMDLINYYRKISAVMIPHLRNRPLTMQRYPDGIQDEGFYQKDIPGYFPPWIQRATLDKREGGEITHVLANDQETLVFLANQACITYHIGLSTQDHINQPDKMIFDLDPPDGRFDLVSKAAWAIKGVLNHVKLDPYLMSTGSRGVHVVVPIIPDFSFNDIRALAKAVAEFVSRENNRDFTTEMEKKNRGNRVFIDYLRNAYGQTSVAPYSIRSMSGAPVATPLEWDELTSGFNPRKYSMANIFRRLGQKEDPWKNIHSNLQPIHSMKDLMVAFSE